MRHSTGGLVIAGLMAVGFRVTPCQSSRGGALFIGAETGSLLPAAVEGSYVRLAHDGRRRWVADLRVEPSNYWQSYSLGAAWHVGDRALFVGGRLRELLLHSPWSRGYDPAVDNHLGLSAETGFRWLPVFADRRLLITVSAGATHVTGSSVALPMIYNLNAGLGWRVLQR